MNDDSVNVTPGPGNEVRVGINTQDQARRADIDGLRAVAVLSVLFFHFKIPPFAGGFVGVDVFFVISGYLITKLILADIEAGAFSFRGFYLRRARRILPALFVTALFTFAVGAVIMSPAALQDLAGSTLAALVSLSNVFFWSGGGYFESDAYAKPLLHTWSLGVEEQFYLFWPALIFLLAQRARRFLFPALAGVFALSFGAAEIALRIDPSAAFYLLPFRAGEFALGALTLRAAAALRLSDRMANVGLLAGLALIAAAAMGFDSLTPFPGLAALAPCVGAALAICCGQAPAGRLLSNPPAVWIGTISYSLYLAHWPVVVFADYWLARDFSVAEATAAFALCFVLAALMHRFVEQPFRRRDNGRFVMPARRLGLILAAIFAVAAPPALSAWISDGWYWRLRDRRVETVRNPRQYRTLNYGGAECSRRRCETDGEPGGKKIYFIGDSHARAYYAGLKTVFPDVKFVLFAANACPLYSLRFGSHRNSYTPNCDKTRQMAFEEISAGDGDVILTEYWAVRMASPHYPATGAARRFKSATAFAEFVDAELAGVKAMIGGRKLTIIGALPPFDGPLSPFDCMTRPLQDRICERSELSSRRIAESRAVNLALKAKRGADQFIDPFDYLCDEQTCRNYTPSGDPIYSDQAHLSRFGATFLVAAMKERLVAGR